MYDAIDVLTTRLMVRNTTSNRSCRTLPLTTRRKNLPLNSAPVAVFRCTLDTQSGLFAERNHSSYCLPYNRIYFLSCLFLSIFIIAVLDYLE